MLGICKGGVLSSFYSVLIRLVAQEHFYIMLSDLFLCMSMLLLCAPYLCGDFVVVICVVIILDFYYVVS